MEDDLLPESFDEHPKREVVIILAVFFEFGLAPFSLFLGWLLGYPPLKTFQWSPQAAIWGVVATVPLILLFLGMLRWPFGPLARVKQFCDYEVVPLLEKSSWSDIALISLSVGVCEEMLFRGVIQSSLIGLLESWLGDWWGVPCGLGLASVFFGLVPSDLAHLHGDRGNSWALPGDRLDLLWKPVDSDDHTHALRFRCSGVPPAHSASGRGQFHVDIV